MTRYVGASSITAPTNLYALINGTTTPGSTTYAIGEAESTDGGLTWTEHGSAVLSVGGGGAWDVTGVKDPCLVWDGSQYVCYYAGFSGSVFQIGRATSADRISWTKDAGNPVVTKGSGSDPDVVGCEFPVVIHDATLSPSWRMWYVGYGTGSTPPGTPTPATVCYADSTNGTAWTKRGQVLGLGAVGQRDHSGLFPGCVALVPGGAGRLFYAGYNTSDNFMRSMTATFTDPANSATYTKEGLLAGFNTTFTINTRTWRSNQPRGIIRSGSGYVVYLDLWNPSDASPYEMCAVSTATTELTWALPTTQMFPVPGSGWDSGSAENPSVIVAP